MYPAISLVSGSHHRNYDLSKLHTYRLTNIQEAWIEFWGTLLAKNNLNMPFGAYSPDKWDENADSACQRSKISLGVNFTNADHERQAHMAMIPGQIDNFWQSQIKILLKIHKSERVPILRPNTAHALQVRIEGHLREVAQEIVHAVANNLHGNRTTTVLGQVGRAGQMFANAMRLFGDLAMAMYIPWINDLPPTPATEMHVLLGGGEAPLHPCSSVETQTEITDPSALEEARARIIVTDMIDSVLSQVVRDASKPPLPSNVTNRVAFTTSDLLADLAATALAEPPLSVPPPMVVRPEVSLGEVYPASGKGKGTKRTAKTAAPPRPKKIKR